jgi:hypothetical protein
MCKRIFNTLLCLIAITQVLAAPAPLRTKLPIEFSGRGPEVLTYRSVDNFRGVVLQATVKFQDEKQQITPIEKLQLRRKSPTSTKLVLTLDGNEYEYDTKVKDLNILAKWVLTGQTGGYTLWPREIKSKDGEPLENLEKHMTWVGRERDAPLFAAHELAKSTDLVQLLHRADFPYNTGLADQRLAQQYNARLGKDFSPDNKKAIDGSYIVTDVDSSFTITLEPGTVKSRGYPLRYYWREYPNTNYPYIAFIDSVEDASTVQLFTATAILRTFAENESTKQYIIKIARGAGGD